MRYCLERAEIICADLLKLSVVQSEEVKSWQIKEGLYWSPDEAEGADTPWSQFDTKTSKWKGPDKNSWFKTEIKVPESFEGKPFSLLFKTNAEGWDAKNPQFLVFINGRHTCAMDVNHRDVRISDCASAGEIYRIDLQAYTGTEHEELELSAKIVEISPLVMDLYFDLFVPLKIIESLNPDDKVRLDLEVAVEKVINAIDLRVAHTDEFFDSIRDAAAIAQEEIYTKLAGHEDVIATCVGHTHIDVAWWWTVAQTRQKTVRSFATVLKHMEEYPEYVFMSSQPQLYAFIKENAPELYERIKERIKEGRWEAEGGMWLEADCNLSSGESLLRQFLYGKRFFNEEFGADSKILWLPDVFGYSAALPQIMQLCGIDYFMTTKMSWNQWNQMPFDTFVWRGMGDREVFAHMITTTEVGRNRSSWFTTYNGKLHPNALMGAWDRYQQKALNNDVLISFGYGDGGGGPTREMIETGKRMAKGIKGAPKVRFKNSRQYFDELYEKTKDNGKLPKWVGELYFEYHRGTLTSMGRNKRSNRKSEYLLHDLEFVSILAEAMPYPEAELSDMWKTVLLNQFHDILPGTSIKEVYDVTKIEYNELEEKAAALLEERLPTATGVTGDLAVINTLGFIRDDVVHVPDGVNAKALSYGNNSLAIMQKTHDSGSIAYIAEIPAKGALGLNFASVPEYANPITINDLKIETPFYTAEFDSKGFIARLVHKESGRQVLTGDAKGNELRVYEDRPMQWSNWDIDIYHKEKSWLVDETTDIKWLEHGPVRATLLVERKFLQSVICQKIHFYADIPRIDFETYVDWKQNQLLLKAHFKTDIISPIATFDIQFGNVERPTHMNTSWDEARFETCAHKWADLSEGGFGVSLLNDCKYGHSIHDGTLSLTLLKSGIEPYPETDQEEHYFTYSLLPHTGTWRDGGTVQSAYNLNLPAYAILNTSAASDLPSSRSFISTTSRNIMIETVKKAEDRNSVIVRMYEYENTRTNASLMLGKKVRAVFETDGLENRIKPVAENTNAFEIIIKPYEIKTLELVFD